MLFWYRSAMPFLLHLPPLARFSARGPGERRVPPTCSRAAERVLLPNVHVADVDTADWSNVGLPAEETALEGVKDQRVVWTSCSARLAEPCHRKGDEQRAWQSR